MENINLSFSQFVLSTFLRILTYMVPLSQKIRGMVLEGRVNYTHDYPSLSLYLGGDISLFTGVLVLS